jgi:hypothetical protein
VSRKRSSIEAALCSGASFTSAGADSLAPLLTVYNGSSAFFGSCCPTRDGPIPSIASSARITAGPVSAERFESAAIVIHVYVVRYLSRRIAVITCSQLYRRDKMLASEVRDRATRARCRSGAHFAEKDVLGRLTRCRTGISRGRGGDQPVALKGSDP